MAFRPCVCFRSPSDTLPHRLPAAAQLLLVRLSLMMHLWRLVNRPFCGGGWRTTTAEDEATTTLMSFFCMAMAAAEAAPAAPIRPPCKRSLPAETWSWFRCLWWWTPPGSVSPWHSLRDGAQRNLYSGNLRLRNLLSATMATVSGGPEPCQLTIVAFLLVRIVARSLSREAHNAQQNYRCNQNNKHSAKKCQRIQIAYKRKDTWHQHCVRLARMCRTIGLDLDDHESALR